MRALSIAGLVSIGAVATFNAHAGLITTVDIFKPGGTVAIAAGVQTLQWANGADASIGFTGVPNSTFLNVYQSTLTGFLDQSSNSITPAPGLGLAFSNSSAYELTVVSRAEFQVSSSGSFLYNLVPNSGTLSIFLDGPGVGSTGVKADPLTGIGFDDGIEIYRGNPFDGGAFLKGTDIVDELNLLTLLVRIDVLSAPGPISDFHFSDTKLLSPTLVPQGFHIGGDAILYPDYTPVPAGNGVIDLINSSAQFSTVPEPSTTGLVFLAGVVMFFCNRLRPRRRV